MLLHVEYSICILYNLILLSIPSTVKVIWGRSHNLVSSDRLEKAVIKLATPGLQGEWFIHYATAAYLGKLVALLSLSSWCL